MATISELHPDECEQLLESGVFGRIVLTTPDGPEILPVNYVAVAGTVLIRTTPGSLLDRHADGVALLLEIDQVDYKHWHGWSVVVRGTGELLGADDLSEDERRLPGPPPWVSREQECWLRIRWHAVSGRRTGTGWSCLAELPVRMVRR